jgi:hypothetical protein
MSAIPPIPVYRAFEQVSSRFTVDPQLKHDLSRLVSMCPRPRSRYLPSRVTRHGK